MRRCLDTGHECGSGAPTPLSRKQDAQHAETSRFHPRSRTEVAGQQPPPSYAHPLCIAMSRVLLCLCGCAVLVSDAADWNQLVVTSRHRPKGGLMSMRLTCDEVVTVCERVSA